MLKAKKKPLETKSLAALGLDASQFGAASLKTRILSLAFPAQRKVCKMISGETAEEKAARLVQACTRKPASCERVGERETIMSDGILVVTEYADKGFRKSTYEVISEGRRLADQLNTSLSAVVLGSGVLAAAAELKHFGADRVLVCDVPELADFDPDRCTPILCDIVMARQPMIVLFGASIRDKQLATRLAAKLDAGLASARW